VSGIGDRIAGLLHGLLAGDRLGCPVEGMSAPQSAARYRRVPEREVSGAAMPIAGYQRSLQGWR
jgi:hypothetical protein